MNQKDNEQSSIEFEPVYITGFTSSLETNIHYSEKDGQCIESDEFDSGIQFESSVQQNEKTDTLPVSRAAAESPVNEADKGKGGVNGERKEGIENDNINRSGNQTPESEFSKMEGSIYANSGLNISNLESNEGQTDSSQQHQQNLFNLLHKSREYEDEVGILAITSFLTPLTFTFQSGATAAALITNIGRVAVPAAMLLPISDDETGGDISEAAFEIVGIGGGVIKYLSKRQIKNTIDALEESTGDTTHLFLKSSDIKNKWSGKSIENNPKLLELKARFESSELEPGTELLIDRNTKLSIEEIGILASNLKKELAVVSRRVNKGIKKERFLILGEEFCVNPDMKFPSDKFILHVHPQFLNASIEDKAAIMNRAVLYADSVERKLIRKNGQKRSMIINENGARLKFDQEGSFQQKWDWDFDYGKKIAVGNKPMQ